MNEINQPNEPQEGIPAADVAAMRADAEVAFSAAVEAAKEPPPKDERLLGFEIVCRNPWGGVSVYGKFRPTELAAKQCAADLKWLQARHPKAGYEMRAIVSVPRTPEAE